MYIQIRDNSGNERFIKEDTLDSCIASGEVVAFRRSDGWVCVVSETRRGNPPPALRHNYPAQERRRSMLGKRHPVVKKEPVVDPVE